MLDWYHYRLNVRRSIHELFDRVTLTPEVLDAYDSRKRRRSTLVIIYCFFFFLSYSRLDKVHSNSQQRKPIWRGQKGR